MSGRLGCLNQLLDAMLFADTMRVLPRGCEGWRSWLRESCIASLSFYLSSLQHFGRVHYLIVLECNKKGLVVTDSVDGLKWG